MCLLGTDGPAAVFDTGVLGSEPEKILLKNVNLRKDNFL